MPKLAVKNYKGIEVELIKNAPNAKSAAVQLKDSILEKVLEVNDIEVPADLVDEEVRMMALDLSQKMKYESLATGVLPEITQEEIDSRLEEFKAEAFTLVKTRLVLKGIIEAEKLEVTQAELEEEAKAISARQQMSIEMVKDFLGEDLSAIKNDLLVRKAIDFIVANAVIQ